MRSSSRLSVAVWTALCALIALSLPEAAGALKAPPPQLSELGEDDRKALETIAGHSERLRDAVLKASLHVDTLVETQRIQEQSSASFQERISKLDRKEQEQIWDIVREPGLLDELATKERPSRAQLDAIAQRHTEELGPAIRSAGARHHELLVDVARVHDRASERFDVAIADLDDESQQAFRDLVDQPELLSVLVRRVNLVVRLGESYRKHPKDTRSYLSALAADVAQRNAAAEKEWKDRLENDPKAAAEFERAARDYSEEYGYDYEELTDPSVRTRVDVVIHPYPYWFGYPVWYSDVYLYPYGWWYPYPPYFGFYHHHHHYVWWGFPSFHFIHWFYWGHHHHHYAYLSHCFTRYYRTYPYASTHFHVTVNNFITRADPIDRHRSDWSWGRGSRQRGDTAISASVSGQPVRGREVFFNRHRAQDSVRLDRSAPGERGIAIDDARGRSGRSAAVDRGGRRGLVAPDRDRQAAPSDTRSLRGPERAERSRGRARDTFQVQEPGTIESPRGGARGGERAARPSRQDAPSFQGSDPQPQREAPSFEPRDRGPRGGGGSRRGGDAPQIHRERGPSVDAAPPSRGDAPSRSGGDRGSFRGGDGGGRSHGGWSGGGSHRGGGGGWGGGGRGGGRGGFGGGGGGGHGDFGGGGGRGR